MAFVLKFDGKTMPTPMYDGFEINREKVWSSNTRRSSSAKMQGTIVAVKTTLKMDFPPNLTKAQIKSITDIVDSEREWHTITFTNEKSETETITAYFGNPRYGVSFFRDGKWMFSSITVEAVER